MIGRYIACPEEKYDYKCPYPMDPIGVTVHNTANDAPAINEVIYMHNNWNTVSYHYAVDDVEFIQALPRDRNAWHAGDGTTGTGNRQTLSVEICYSLSGGPRFDAAERNGAKLVAEILVAYGWGLDDVYKHQDWSGKYCPHRTLDYGWDRFMGMVAEEYNALLTPAPAEPAPETPNTTELYRVQVGAFKDGSNAERLVQTLKSKGYKAYVTLRGDFNRVQVGAFANIDNANKLIDKLDKDGFKAILVKPVGATSETPAPAPAEPTFSVGDTVVVTVPEDINGTSLAVSGYYTVMQVDSGRVVIGRDGVVTAAMPPSHISR